MPAWSEFAFLLVTLTLFTPKLGAYMANIFEGTATGRWEIVGVPERAIYRACRIDPSREMSWQDVLSSLTLMRMAPHSRGAPACATP